MFSFTQKEVLGISCFGVTHKQLVRIAVDRCSLRSQTGLCYAGPRGLRGWIDVRERHGARSLMIRVCGFLDIVNMVNSSFIVYYKCGII